MVRSDLMVGGSLMQVTHHDYYSVIRTPTEPDYWSGNIIVINGESVDPRAEIALFRVAHPDAAHCRVMWDVPGMALDHVSAVLTPDGFDVSIVETLILNGEMRAVDVPDGIALRTIKTDQDWADFAVFQTESAIEEGRDMAVHAPFQTRRNAAKRAQNEAGFGAWFAAYDGDLMVGTLGMYVGEGLARYQAVETRASHRKRGISSALLRHAFEWARGQDPDAQVIIVADAQGDGGRLYRKMGFTLAEAVVEAHRDGY